MSMEYVGVPLRITANAMDRYGKCVLEIPGLDGSEAAGEIITLDADDCARVNVAHWIRAELVEVVRPDAPPAAPPAGKGGKDAPSPAAPASEGASGIAGDAGRAGVSPQRGPGGAGRGERE